MIEEVESVEILAPRDDADALSEEDIGEVARLIRRMRDVAGLQFAVAVGQLVVDRFFEGDLDLFRARGAKSVSLRRLTVHPELPFSASTLSRTVAIFEVVERVGGLEAVRSLTHSHLRYVLGLPETVQLALIREADDEAWPVARMADEARKARDVHPGAATGRPPLPRFVKSVHALRKFVEPEAGHFADLEAVDDLSAQDASELQTTVVTMLERLGVLQARLHARVRAADAEVADA